MALRVPLEQIGAEIVLVGAKDFIGVVQQTERSIDKLNSSVQKLSNDSNSAFTSMQRVAIGAIGAVSLAVGSLIGVLAGVGGASLKAAGDYDDAMQVIRGVTLGTDEEIKALDKTIVQLASTTKVSMQSAAEAAAELARAGVEVKDQTEGALKAVIDLSIASAGELGLERSAVLVGSALKAFRLEGDQAARVANAVTVAAQNSAVTFVDLQRSFQQAAPSAALLGLTVEDLAATLGVLGEQGIRGSDAGTSLKQAFQQLIHPSKQGLAAMKEYGISLFDATGKSRDFREVIKDLEHAFGDQAVAEGRITEAQRAAALATIGGSDAIRALIVAAQRGVSAFDSFDEMMRDSSRSAEAMAKIMQESLNSQLQILLNNVNILANRFGGAFVPAIKEAVAQSILFARSLIPVAEILGTGLASALSGKALPTDFTEQLNNIVSPEAAAAIQGFIDLIERVRAVAVGDVLPALGGLKDAINDVLLTVASPEAITGAFEAIGDAIVTAAAVVITFAEGLTNLINSQQDLTIIRDVLIAIAAVPLLTVAVAVGAITLAIAQAVGPALLLIAALTGIVFAIARITDAGSGIQRALVQPFADGADDIADIIDAIGDLTPVQAEIDAQSGDIQDAIVSPFEDAANQIADIIDQLAADTTDQLANVVDELGNIDISFPDNAIVSPVGDLLPQSEVDQVTEGFSEISDASEETHSAVREAAEGMSGAIEGFINGFLAFKDEIATGDQELGRAFSELGATTRGALEGIAEIPGVIGDIIGTVLSSTGIFIGDFVGLIGQGVTALTETVAQIIQTLGGISKGLDFLLQAGNSFVNGWVVIWNSVIQVAVNAANAVISAVNNVISAMSQLPGAGAIGSGQSFQLPIVGIGAGVAVGVGRAAIGGIGDAFNALGTNIRTNLDSINAKSGELVLNLKNVGGTGDTLRERLARLAHGSRDAAGAFDDLGNKGAGGAKKAKKGAEDAAPAIDGFIDALTKAARLQAFKDAFGDAGAEAVDSLVNAVVSNVDKDGAKVATALHKLEQEARKANIENWQELADDADAAFARALIDRSDDAIEAAKQTVAAIANAMKAQGELSFANFSHSFNLATTAANLGSEGAKLMDSLKEAIAEGGTKVVTEAGKAAQGLAASFFEKLPIDKAREFAGELMDGIRDVIRHKTPQAIEALNQLIQRLNFDSAIAKAAEARDKAINEAVKKTDDAIAKAKTDAFQANEKLIQESNQKSAFDIRVQQIKDANDAVLDSFKKLQDGIALGRKRRREDAERELDQTREDADRLEKLNDDIAKARKNSSARADKAKGPQGGIELTASSGVDDEIKKIRDKYAEETIQLDKKRKREAEDLARKREDENADIEFQGQQQTALAEAKKLLDKDVQRIKDEEELRQFHARLIENNQRANDEITEKKRALEETKKAEDEKFENEVTKLTEIKNLSDTLLDGFLDDLDTAVEKAAAISDSIAGSWAIEIRKLAGATSDSAKAKNDADETADIGTRNSPEHSNEADPLRRVAQAIQSVVDPESMARGGPVQRTGLIRAHSGEYVLNIEQVSMLERLFKPSPVNSNSVTYQVNASYSNMQSEASVRDDMISLVALTS